MKTKEDVCLAATTRLNKLGPLRWDGFSDLASFIIRIGFVPPALHCELYRRRGKISRRVL